MRTFFKRPAVLAVAATVALAGGVMGASAASGSDDADIRVWVPRGGDVAGVETRGFVLDFAVRFTGDLASTGASLELTGPAAHNTTAPLPGSFGLGANQDHFPGLVVLLSSTKIGAGAGQNLANEFNINGVTNRKGNRETEIWATWIVGAKGAFAFQQSDEHPHATENSKLFVSVVKGAAPDVVDDLDNDGRRDEKDLQAMGYDVIGGGETVDFKINRLP
jgi:hypothetical protein